MHWLYTLGVIFLLTTVSSFKSDVDSENEGVATETKQLESSPFTALLGETLYRWKKNADNTMEVEELYTSDLLKGKNAVAIYFSASWCGPCKQFTPILAQLYKNLNKKGKKFEVVWLSRDRSSEEFLSYYQQMPWLAVTLQNVQPILEKLAPKYELKGIPHLVILDGDDATVITLDGRTAIAKDQYGLEFPWRARTLLNLMPKPLKRLVKAQIVKVGTSLQGLLQGIIQGIAPGKVAHWFKDKTAMILMVIKEKIVMYIREKVNRSAPAETALAPGKGSTVEGNSQNRRKQIETVEMDDDIDLDDISRATSIQEESDVLISA